MFDGYLHKKFPQLKRYGLEGVEGMMIAMHRVLEQAATKHSIQDAVICMPHRGRLNLLGCLLELPARTIFHKIKGNNELPSYENGYCGTGDVLSHLGQSVDLKFSKNNIHCTLLHNPSHLEVLPSETFCNSHILIYFLGSEPSCSRKNARESNRKFF